MAFERTCVYIGYMQTNAKTIFRDNNVKVTNSEFTYELEKALVLPSLQWQFKNPNGLQIKILNKMRRVLNIQEVNHRPQTENQRTKSGRFWLQKQTRETEQQTEIEMSHV